MKLIRKLISRYKSWQFNRKHKGVYQRPSKPWDESVLVVNKELYIHEIDEGIKALMIKKDELKRRKQKHSHIQKQIETLTARKIDLELDAAELFGGAK